MRKDSGEMMLEGDVLAVEGARVVYVRGARPHKPDVAQGYPVVARHGVRQIVPRGWDGEDEAH